MKLRINESVYEIIYDYTSEEGYEENNNVEQFEGTWTDLQDYIKQMRRNGCYNISANEISDYESVRSHSGRRMNESSDRIVSRTFDGMIDELNKLGYNTGSYDSDHMPSDNWLYIGKNNKEYEAEFTKYSDGRYELMLYNINPTGEDYDLDINESLRKRNMTESYGTLADYLERHLDSWYGRLNEVAEDIEELGLDIDEINGEYIIVHATEPDGEDAYCKIRLGGTERTISLETFEMLESVKRSKKAISESYYSYDNLRISEILDKIEQTNDQRKIDRAYDFIGHACDNIDACMETGFYDLSDASWGYETGYIIEELTNILNESIR